MELKEERTERCLVVCIAGRLDTITSGEMEERLNSIFSSGENRILADCSKLDYISSSGLRVLLSGLKKARAAGGILAVCALRENVREIFDISGFSTLFEIFKTKEEGIKSLK